MIDTANDEITIVDKNGTPSVDKEIKEGDTTVDENTVNIGDTVNYQVTVSAKKGAKNYVLHDTMKQWLNLRCRQRFNCRSYKGH